MDKFENIKSNYIFKKIFSLLYINRNLKIVSYTKKLQDKLTINLDLFKKISGKEQHISEDGFIREYNLYTNKLIFEGECLNRKKNGKGKEYDESENKKIIFEGEYKNGEKISGTGYDDKGHVVFELKNNKGKEYYKKRKIKFEGEYLNGKRWNGIGYNYLGHKQFEIKYGQGFWEDYNYDGKKIIEGQHSNGLLNGIGKEYYNSSGKLKFEGEYLNGKKNGKGKEFYGNGHLLYEGEYLNNKKNGIGKEYNDNSNNLRYEGEYLEDKKTGKGKEYYDYKEKNTI